jgi:hypothetical protein
MSAIGPKQTSANALHMSAFGGKADILIKEARHAGHSSERLPDFLVHFDLARRKFSFEPHSCFYGFDINLITRLYLSVDLHNITFLIVYRSRKNILHRSPIPCPSRMRRLLHYFFLKPQTPVENRGVPVAKASEPFRVKRTRATRYSPNVRKIVVSVLGADRSLFMI